MTYPRQGTSTFIEQFFEKPKRSLGGLTRPNVTQKTLWAAKDYFPGTQVEHSVFGQGTITEVKGELATVIFRSGGDEETNAADLYRKWPFEIGKKIIPHHAMRNYFFYFSSS